MITPVANNHEHKRYTARRNPQFGHLKRKSCACQSARAPRKIAENIEGRQDVRKSGAFFWPRASGSPLLPAQRLPLFSAPPGRSACANCVITRVHLASFSSQELVGTA